MTNLRNPRLLLALTLSLPCAPTASTVAGEATAQVGQQCRQATIRFLDSLGPELQEQARFAFESKERTDWHFIPKERTGVSLKEMNLSQRRAAHELLRTVLSNRGYLKATAIMSLEEVLRQLEADRPQVEQIRDQEKYWFAVFGTPEADGPWGWRVEGHHLSLNFSSVTGELIATTPAFYGANPAEIRAGPRAGLRVLGAEEDLARQIVADATSEQLPRIVIASEAPRDVITGPGQALDATRPEGVPLADMNDIQRQQLRALIGEFAHNLRGPLAAKELATIEQAGVDKIHFAWAGSLKRGEGHYWRVQGPTFIIEYDSTQNDANHIHTVWHSLENDFAEATLREHYRQHPHH